MAPDLHGIVEALERYGRHDYACHVYEGTPKVCSCGFGPALTAARTVAFAVAAPEDPS